MLRLLLLTAAVVVVVVGLDFRTIKEYLADQPDMTILAQLIHQANLDHVLEAPGAIFTLFAPNDDAMTRLPVDVMVRLSTDQAFLQQTLMSHVVSSAFLSIYMTNDHVETTLAGTPLRFNVYNRTFTAEGGPITRGDVVLRNGVLHVIDGVILPPEGDILRQILLDDAEFEDLTAALAATNLLEELEVEALTLFAPLNSAFHQFYSDGLPNNMEQVKDLLLNHLVNGTFYKAGLKEVTSLTTLSGHRLVCGTTEDGEASINDQPASRSIFATNGVIHVMTSVLDPSANEAADP